MVRRFSCVPFCCATLNEGWPAAFKNRPKSELYPLLLFGGSSMVTAMAILFGFASYFYPINLEKLRIKGNSLDRLVSLAEPFIGPRIPGYQKGMTVDELLKANINSSIEQSLGGNKRRDSCRKLAFAIPPQALQGIKDKPGAHRQRDQNELNKQKLNLAKSWVK